MFVFSYFCWRIRRWVLQVRDIAIENSPLADLHSYKWAEVLSCDAYDAFEHVEDISVIGRQFRDTVLSLGGSVAPTEVFKAFRGRSYRTDAILRAYGLAP